MVLLVYVNSYNFTPFVCHGQLNWGTVLKAQLQQQRRMGTVFKANKLQQQPTDTSISILLQQLTYRNSHNDQQQQPPTKTDDKDPALKLNYLVNNFVIITLGPFNYFVIFYVL